MTEAKDRILATAAELVLTMTAEFVPWSKSRNAKPTPTMSDRSLNWRVTLKRAGAVILETDYMAGIAHCPSHNFGARETLDYAEKIARETETGRRATSWGGTIQPEFADVLHSLVTDSEVLNARSFEDWAGDFGYDTDSRKGEAIYRACLDIALRLRNGIGEAGLQRLAEACQDY